MNKAILFIFSGLPAVGKSTLAAFVAREFKATYLRIDTIEQGLRDLCSMNIEGEGYRLAYRIAEDNLKLNRNVVADCCNPMELTRNEWEEIANTSSCGFINIEVICSDKAKHRKRAEERNSEIAHLKLPVWKDIETREYHAWAKDRIVIDTANKAINKCETELKLRIADILSGVSEQTCGNTDNYLKTVILERLCYTEFIYERVNRKLGLHFSPAEIEKFISEIIERTDDMYFEQKGKNFYITNEAEHIRITVNSNTYRLITADKI